MKRLFLISLYFTTSLGLAGCGDDSGESDAAVDADATLDGTLDAGDAARPIGPECEELASTPPMVSCEILETDYRPGAEDMWPPCISDDGEYNRIQESISSIARVRAFDEIGETLFDPASPASPEEFLAARMIYQTDEGLDSRVVRRYDPHFSVPEGTDCTVEGVPEMFPSYCVGPAILQPIILNALRDGSMGEGDPIVHAAHVEAGLLWFFYASQYKESFTCTTKAKDCDSAYAYYTGGEPARGGVGLAGRVASADSAAHDRAWDGLLASRYDIYGCRSTFYQVDDW